MVANKKVTGRASSVPGGLASGMLTGLVITLLASAFAAYLASREVLAQDMFGYCAMGVLVLASFAGAAVAVRRIKKMPLQMAVASGLLLYVMLISMTALFFGGQYDAMGITLVLVLIGSGAGGILASGKPVSRKRKYHRI